MIEVLKWRKLNVHRLTVCLEELQVDFKRHIVDNNMITAAQLRLYARADTRKYQ